MSFTSFSVATVQVPTSHRSIHFIDSDFIGFYFIGSYSTNFYFSSLNEK